MQFSSKYHDDEAEEWVKSYSDAHPDHTVAWSEEWDDEEAGHRVGVWRRGSRIEAESATSQLVPEWYFRLIDGLRGEVARNGSRESLAAAVTEFLDSLVAAHALS